MSKISVRDLIAQFEKMFKEHWAYVPNKADKGAVDCSGAFVWAYKQFGKSIAHGSNAIARNYCGDLLPISAAAPGMAAFKYRPPGHKLWKLPQKYRNHPDQNDYYHIGLVDNSGKYVLNAQSSETGFVKTKLSAWGKVAYLNAIDYEEQEVLPMRKMMVTCPPGETVRLRAKPDASATTLVKIPSGTMVEGTSYNASWWNVSYGDKRGYMMAGFLAPMSESVATSTDLPATGSQTAQNALQTASTLVNGNLLTPTVEAPQSTLERVSVSLDKNVAYTLYFALKTAIEGGDSIG